MFRKYTPLKYLATYDGAKLPGAIKSWKLATFFWRRSLARLLDKHLGLTANGAWCSVLCAGYLGWGDMVVIAQVNDSRGAARSTNVV